MQKDDIKDRKIMLSLPIKKERLSMRKEIKGGRQIGKEKDLLLFVAEA